MSSDKGEERRPQDDLVRSIIMSHYRNSSFRHSLENPTFSSGQVNRACGDRVELFLHIQDGIICEAAFQGEGCSLCISSASILCQEIQGQSVPDALHLFEDFKAFLGSEQGSYVDQRGSSDALTALGSVRSYGARIPCVLLSWNILTKLA